MLNAKLQASRLRLRRKYKTEGSCSVSDPYRITNCLPAQSGGVHMSHTKKVLIVGDVNMDLVIKYPKKMPDGTMDYPTPELAGGGTCGNTLIALCKLGVDTAFMGTIGDDPYGQRLSAEMESFGVDMRALITDPTLVTVCVYAFVDDSGERYLWAWPRQRESFKYLDPDALRWESVEEASWVHSSGMMLTYDTSARSSVIEIFRRAKALNLHTSFDLNLRAENGRLDEGFRQAVLEIIQYCDYVLGSGPDEIRLLYPDYTNWQSAARRIAQDGRIVIARLGAGGSMAFNGENEIKEKAFNVRVVDTIGAGDVYNAGFIAARLSGMSIRQSMVWGNGVSGFKVGKKGARRTPCLDELKDFIALADKKGEGTALRETALIV